MFDRLTIVAWPWLACAGFAGGLLCAGWLVYHMHSAGLEKAPSR
jgi:hypothetical protein